MESGASVWVRDADLSWISATIVRKVSGQLLYSFFDAVRRIKINFAECVSFRMLVMAFRRLSSEMNVPWR